MKKQDFNLNDPRRIQIARECIYKLLDVPRSITNETVQMLMNDGKYEQAMITQQRAYSDEQDFRELVKSLTTFGAVASVYLTMMKTIIAITSTGHAVLSRSAIDAAKQFSAL